MQSHTPRNNLLDVERVVVVALVTLDPATPRGVSERPVPLPPALTQPKREPLVPLLSIFINKEDTTTYTRPSD